MDIYDPVLQLQPGHIAFVKVEADGSTQSRGWEVCYVFSLPYNAGVFHGVYLRPASAGPASIAAGSRSEHWPAEWWRGNLTPFSHVPEGGQVLKDWEFTDAQVADVRWSGLAAGRNKCWRLRANHIKYIPAVLAALSDTELEVPAPARQQEEAVQGADSEQE